MKVEWEDPNEYGRRFTLDVADRLQDGEVRVVSEWSDEGENEYAETKGYLSRDDLKRLRVHLDFLLQQP
jgi:hypothetical protein